jgi:hypothetical protein
MSTTKVSTRTETVNANASLEEFPAGLPRPDHARNWGRSAESVLAQRGLTDVSQGKITPGTFEPLWPDELLEDPPALPANASFSDRARYTSSSTSARPSTPDLLLAWRRSLAGRQPLGLDEDVGRVGGSVQRAQQLGGLHGHDTNWYHRAVAIRCMELIQA